MYFIDLILFCGICDFGIFGKNLIFKFSCFFKEVLIYLFILCYNWVFVKGKIVCENYYLLWCLGRNEKDVIFLF